MGEATAYTIVRVCAGSTEAEVVFFIEEYFHYNLGCTCDEIRRNYRHVEFCQETVPKAITAFRVGAFFENVIRMAISLGDDCDTMTILARTVFDKPGEETLVSKPIAVQTEAF